MSRPHLHVLSAALCAQEASLDLIHAFVGALAQEMEDAGLPEFEDGEPLPPAILQSVYEAALALENSSEEHMQAVLRKALNDALATWAAMQSAAH